MLNKKKNEYKIMVENLKDKIKSMEEVLEKTELDQVKTE